MTQTPPQLPRFPRSWRGWVPSNRSWLDAHTIAAAVFGAASAALISWVVLSFLNPWSTDGFLRSAHNVVRSADEAEQAAAQQAYDDAYDEALAAAVEWERIAALGDLVVNAGEGENSAWAEEFRRGWAAGWNEALDAMRAAAIEAGIPPNASDFRALDATPRR